jgi:hypothetical protein
MGWVGIFKGDSKCNVGIKTELDVASEDDVLE